MTNDEEKYSKCEKKYSGSSPHKLTHKNNEENIVDKHNSNFPQKLERNFKVNYPDQESATYKSLVNYTSDTESAIQRWYRYKEGYSVKLIQDIFDRYNVQDEETILDPFCGGGSTLLQSKRCGLDSVGFEINPFVAFLSRVKTRDYEVEDAKKYENVIDRIKDLNISGFSSDIKKPKLSTIDKLYNHETLNYLLEMRKEIKSIEPKKVRDLIALGWFSILESCSHYRKGGNGLKKRKDGNKKNRDVNKAKNLFNSVTNKIMEDLEVAIDISQERANVEVFEENSLNLDSHLERNSIGGCIFSPPYANCFDYMEIYKLELWMGEFVESYEELSDLRGKGIRSHLHGFRSSDEYEDYPIKEINELVKSLEKIDLWDQRIPQMLGSYFRDMFTSLEKIHDALEADSFCNIIVGSSAYGGMIIPTDLMIAKSAEVIGYKVEQIDIARYTITSSQQYKSTEEYNDFLRESIIRLRK